MTEKDYSYTIEFISAEERDAYRCIEDAFNEMVANGHEPNTVIESILLYGLVRVHLSEDLGASKELSACWIDRALEIHQKVFGSHENEDQSIDFLTEINPTLVH